MDDTRLATFFLRPTDPTHRHYEALRAVLVEQQPMQDVATRLGYRYDTVRALVSRFRRQVAAGQPPPFLSPPAAVVPPVRRSPSPPPPICPPSRMRGASVWLRDADCGPDRPASSCSSLCSSAFVSTTSSAEPVIPAPAWSPRAVLC
jgi:hypothetical protein